MMQYKKSINPEIVRLKVLKLIGRQLVLKLVEMHYIIPSH